jgi:hypothetical protein
MTISYENMTAIAVGTISISSYPTRANVYLAPDVSGSPGTYVNKGIVASITDVPIGNYFIKLTLYGYADYITTSFAVTANTDTPIIVTFAGSLNISSVLPGAYVYIDSSETALGITPLVVTGLTPGMHTYRLALDGYANTAVIGSNIVVGQMTTVSNVSFLGSVSFTSSPTGAEIWIDGSYTGLNTPSTVKGMNVGPREYKLVKDGHADKTGTFIATNDTTTIVPLVTFTGSLDISSVLPGASVYIDSSKTALGITPLVVTGLNPGTHTYQLKLTGYADTAIIGFNIAEGQTTTVSNVSFLGSVLFRSSPTGARIWIDNIDTGIDTQGTVQGLTAGSRKYTLVKDGFIDKTGTFTAANDTIIAIPPITFIAMPIPTFGNLSISSVLSGASVYIDSSEMALGVTPLIITNLNPGMHTYQLKLIGYADTPIIGFYVVAGQTTIVSNVSFL